MANPPPEITATALLTTCHAIHDEALLSFYREACIHFSIRSKLFMPIEASQIRLPMLMHLSIGISTQGLCHQLHTAEGHPWIQPTKERLAWNEEIDLRVATCIDTVLARCPLLRTFTLHILPGECPRDSCEVANFLQAPSQYSKSQHTLSALGNLKVRDTFAIVAEEYTDLPHYEEVRHAIAPNEDWHTLTLKAWPMISLTEEEYELVEAGSSRNGHLLVPMWYHQPKDSKALGLPKYLRVEDVLRTSADETSNANSSNVISSTDDFNAVGSSSNPIIVGDSDEWDEEDVYWW